MDSLQTFADPPELWPRLVSDRGFGNESLVCHLAAERATFHMCLKAGRHVDPDEQRLEVQDLEVEDAAVALFGLTLRVIQHPNYLRQGPLMSSSAWCLQVSNRGSPYIGCRLYS